MKEERKKWRRLAASALCLAGSVALYLAVSGAGARDSPLTADGRLARDGYGGKTQEYELYVDGLGAEEEAVTVQISPMVYSSEEAEALFYDIMDQMEERIRGENPSLMEVTQDLALPSVWEGGVRLRWSSSRPTLMDSSGHVTADLEEPEELILRVRLSTDPYQADFELPVRLLPRPLTKKEALRKGLEEVIVQADQEESGQEYLQLPAEYDGYALSWREKTDRSNVLILLLGLLAAILLFARDGADERKKEKKREQELLLDYSELVSKLMILVGAGMTVRNAWERMVNDYEAGCRAGRQKKRAAYEEMQAAWVQIAGGIPEGTAIREFGRRCGLQPYRKLSSLLEQNRRTGTKNLRAILAEEAEDAFEMRKNLARSQGEEAGTKLLGPLFLMLGIVMVMIMVPAMMAMG
ncbi:MAG: hypothetical protein LUE86_10120 [Clostridiales bacterium]|nr:hypothetical protein [Clostridiales bacterium]